MTKNSAITGSPLQFNPARRVRLATGLLLVMLLVALQPLSAATAVLNPARDNTIYQGTSYQNNTCGSGTAIFAGNNNNNPGAARRALLDFDVVGNIPAGSTINSVSLTVTLDQTGDSQMATMTLQPVLLGWGEGSVNCSTSGGGGGGGGTGATAASGDATWLSAAHQQTSWAAAGGDFGAVSATTSATNQNGMPITWDSATNPAMVTDVQSWLDTPAGNLGWIMRGNETSRGTARRMFSRESPTTPPVLNIEFTPPAAEFACCFANGDCSITTENSCTGQSGTPDTNTNSCGPNPCPQPVGACCNQDESCSETIARDVCETGGGLFQGGSSVCSASDCGLAKGHCQHGCWQSDREQETCRRGGAGLGNHHGAKATDLFG